MSKTLDLFNKIIAESEEKHNKDTYKNVIDGSEEKPNVIQEEDDVKNEDETPSEQASSETDETQNNEQEDVQTEATDPTEEEFIKNIIRAAELQAANEAIKSFIKDVSSSLGTNSATYTGYAKTRLNEINDEFKTVVSSIKSSREKILEEAEKAKSKENLISIFDKAIDNVEASEKEDKNEIETIISDSEK